MNLLTGITEAQTCTRLSWGVFVFSIFLKFIFIVRITYFFQGNKVFLYELISLEGATPLFPKEVVLDQRTGMIGMATAGDDLEVLVILRTIKSAVSHFVGDKKIYQDMRIETISSQKKVIISR